MTKDTKSRHPAEHPSYQLAFEDFDLLAKVDLRPLRLQLKLLKPEWYLRQARVRYASYYEQARQFSAMVSARFQQEQRRDFVVVTGGGPGIMEAANRGDHEVSARSAGLNFQLPHQQTPNRVISEGLCFRFYNFALRKMRLLMRAKALVAFPGGERIGLLLRWTEIFVTGSDVTVSLWRVWR